jgi:hypothetical protein
MAAPAVDSELGNFSADTLFVFDWDDTLLPSSWLHQTGILPNPTSKDMGAKQEHRDLCETVAPHVAALISRAKEFGQVMIVTNATKCWVEHGCALFMPSILPLILSIPIISAFDLYEYSSSNPMMWKKYAFQNDLLYMAFNGLPMNKRNIISIGDGEPERHAVHALTYSPYGTILAKSLKFREKPSPVMLIEELKATLKAIPFFVASLEPLDLMWKDDAPSPPPTPPAPPAPPAPLEPSVAKVLPRIQRTFKFDWDTFHAELYGYNRPLDSSSPQPSLTASPSESASGL